LVERAQVGQWCSYFSRDLENLSPNLSLALSYKEREAEYIFLFGEALNSPPSCKKSEASFGFPMEQKAKQHLVSPFLRGTEGGSKGGTGGNRSKYCRVLRLR